MGKSRASCKEGSKKSEKDSKPPYAAVGKERNLTKIKVWLVLIGKQTPNLTIQEGKLALLLRK
ncbi:hypothetical protein [Marinomonas gallaica]|uniref:hypothetical protein n=1 Tax=Marinomonas gallaica TaxID=1806667 RepID=UPI001112C0EF|nr:hypothetical protein [Marinomonas gallaica]